MVENLTAAMGHVEEVLLGPSRHKDQNIVDGASFPLTMAMNVDRKDGDEKS